jgi:hypothetical protein
VVSRTCGKPPLPDIGAALPRLLMACQIRSHAAAQDLHRRSADDADAVKTFGGT